MEMMTNAIRAVEPRWALEARANTSLLDQIAAAIDGPFHLIHPATFVDNLQAFQGVLRRHEVAGEVYFGKKANKAGAWLYEVARHGGSVDVASVPEFAQALAKGIRGEAIGVTGAAKSNELLWLAARHGATVAIDALDELERAIIITGQTGPLRILLRVLPPNRAASRFGFKPLDLDRALQRCSETRSQLIMDGFSFHLEGYAVAPRAELAHVLIDKCIAARAAGLPSSGISIGGGFACSYVAEMDWIDFQNQMSRDDFHADKDFSHFYPYYQAPTGAAMLDDILSSKVNGTTLADKLISSNVKLYLEPGRALLDGAGMTIFPVQGFKQNEAHGIVTVAGLSMSLSEQWKNSEFLPSPMLIQRGTERPQTPVKAAIGGSSCMEYDMLTWRKISFPAAPRYGDLIAYPNTAGYQMDKNESEFHQLALPPKVILSQEDNGFTWRLDQ